MAHWGDIQARVETAFKTWLTSAVAEENREGYGLVQAIEGGTLTDTDRIVVFCPTAEEYKPLKGNFMVTVNVSVRTTLNPPDDRVAAVAAHRSVFGYVVDQLNNRTICADLEGVVDDVKFQSTPVDPRAELEFQEDVMVNSFEFEIMACPAP